VVEMTLKYLMPGSRAPTSMAHVQNCVRPQEGRTKGGTMWNHPEGTSCRLVRGEVESFSQRQSRTGCSKTLYALV